MYKYIYTRAESESCDERIMLKGPRCMALDRSLTFQP
jgi:hypothetical protein